VIKYNIVSIHVTIAYRTKQACAYADNTALVGCNLDSLMEMSDTLEEKSQALGLRKTEEKTKYMNISSEDRRWTPTVTLGKYTFERVKCFSYLGTILSSENIVRLTEGSWLATERTSPI
jgi:hypothetical protein